MILYNVTVGIDTSLSDQWVKWMKEVHIPDMMKTGLFVDYKFLKLLSGGADDESGQTFAVQYFCESPEKLERYKTEFAPALRAEHQKLFGQNAVAFRTELEVIG